MSQNKKISAKACPSLKEAREMIAKKEIKPSELIGLSLERIKESEEYIHANILVCEEEAKKRAADLDSKDPDKLPLLGIPISLEDLFCTKDTVSSSASKMLKNFTAPYDASIVERLEEAGAIIVAKNNMDEFSMGSGTEFSAFGKSSNPWDLSRIPGGSASAASVAARQVCASLGADSGGSLRQSASFCGCVALKPSYGRVSRYGAVACASSFDQVGPVANSVEDCALLMEIIAGYDPKDSSSAQVPVPSYRKALKLTDLKGLKLGLPKELWEQDLEPEVIKLCKEAVQKAQDLGAEILELSLPSLNYSLAAYYVLASAEASTNMARYDGVRFGERAKGEDDDLESMYSASRSLNFGEEVKRRIILGTHVLSSSCYEKYYEKAARVRRLVADDFKKAYEKCTALLAPISPRVAWKHDKFKDKPLEAYKMDFMTQSLNMAGLPALSLPLGLGEESQMPVGLQIMGKSFDEEGILSIGKVLEDNIKKLGLPQGLL